MANNRDDARKIYYDKDWADRRLEAKRHLSWYDGSVIREMRSQIPDLETGQPVPLYPIAFNVISPTLQIHQALTTGALPDYNSTPFEIRFRSEDEDRDGTNELKKVFRKLLRDSNAGSMFTEAFLMSQVDGGMVFKVNWEPYSDFLRYRSRWLYYRPHMISPIWNKSDPWRLEECYLGWEISVEDAKNKYGVDVQKGQDRVVYLEHWDKESYRITVDGVVPTNTEYGPLEGQHGIGRVPFVYIPHPYRDESGFWGSSHIPDLIGLDQEINEIKADISEGILDITHPDMWVRDVRKAGGVKLTYLTDQNHRPRPVWDLGDTGSLPGSQPPEMGYVTHDDIAESVMKWPEQLVNDAHWNVSLPLAATGREHYTSGRITGVGTQNQLGAILYHTQEERMLISQGIVHLVDISLRMFEAHQGDYTNLGIDGPKILDKHYDYETVSVWSPQLPMEADKESEMINQDVVAGTTSIETALIRKHVPDPVEEMAKIKADMEFNNELQIKLAEAQAQAKAVARPPAQGA